MFKSKSQKQGKRFENWQVNFFSDTRLGVLKDKYLLSSYNICGMENTTWEWRTWNYATSKISRTISDTDIILTNNIVMRALILYEGIDKPMFQYPRVNNLLKTACFVLKSSAVGTSFTMALLALYRWNKYTIQAREAKKIKAYKAYWYMIPFIDYCQRHWLPTKRLNKL